MNLINVENLKKSYGDKIIFDNISFGVNTGDCIGIIGKNGEGKTTLLKVLKGIEEVDEGRVILSSQTNIEYLSQDMDFDGNLTVLDQVLKGDSKNIKVVRNYEKEISKASPDSNRILKLTEEMDAGNYWELESKVKTILTRLGIDNFNDKISSLSGGQKRRVALAGSLLNESDILILDEPTNHLDNKTIEWLEDSLKERKMPTIMVTHDRYFLNKVTNKIMELDKGKIYEYDGNYEYFLEKKEERMERELATERKRKSIYKKELAWMQQGIKARGTRSKSRVERFRELEASELELKDEKVDISVKGTRLGKKIIEIEKLSKSYGDRKIIDDFTYTLLRDDRIGIVGKNGEGKSTLMNILSGKIEDYQGRLEIGETIKIGYFSQEIEDMDKDKRAIEYIKDIAEFIEVGNGDKVSASKMMERFLFSKDEQWTPIGKLSGGEKRRLFLLKILMAGPNMLILDEPTNDLDIGTLNVLEDYIEEFHGPVVVVSHDRYFLDRIVDSIFHIEDGKIKEYPGNYTYFRENCIKISEESKPIVVEKKKETYRKKPTLKFSYKEQKEWDSIDEDIRKLEDRVDKIANQMEENQTDYVKLQELMEEKLGVEGKLEIKMDRWVELSELKESIDNQ